MTGHGPSPASPVVDLGRAQVGVHENARSLEWLVTNGIGGYASGTVSGILTRRYHGLLVAALDPPLGRTVLVSKLDESVDVAGETFDLFANEWSQADSPTTVLKPKGYRYLVRFHLEDAIPVWTYRCGAATFEKRVWMEPDANTTYVRYDRLRGVRPLGLRLKGMVTYRDFHSLTRGDDWTMDVVPAQGGVRVTAFDGATPFSIMGGDQIVHHDWYRDYHLAAEQARGLEAATDNLFVAEIAATLEPGGAVTIIATAEETTIEEMADRGGDDALERRRAYEAGLVEKRGMPEDPPWVRQLALAADQFIVRRGIGEQPMGRTVIAGYHWFGDWGRDTMIALPGVALATGRTADAAAILRTFARYVDGGMLPNRFPDEGGAGDLEYNTVDATLWYFEAIRAYHEVTEDDGLVADLFPVLEEIIDWHQRGTRFGIGVDPVDGLLAAGQPGVQLTWMDAKVGDWVVTPRIGKPVEVNALWYHALRTMEDFARLLGKDSARYTEAANKVESSFGRFWNQERDYCFDVLDGPDGDDPSLRPNQLLAVSLLHSPLDRTRQRAVVTACERELVTPLGLRTLAPGEPGYRGELSGGVAERDGAYHQGTVWPWLLGPFVAAHVRVHRDPIAAARHLEPLAAHLCGYGLGSIAECADGDSPHTPKAAVAQAWSVGEALRAWDLVTEMLST